MATKWLERPEQLAKQKALGAKGMAVDSATLDEIEAALSAPAEKAHKVHDGMRRAVSGVERLYACGLTKDALVILVLEKCARTSNGGRFTADTVSKVIDALGRLDEYLVAP